MAQPHLLVEEGDVRDVVLMPGDPGRVERIAQQCSAPTEVARNREYLVVNAQYREMPLTICSTGIGSPSAAIAAEELANVGAKTLLRAGTTGALQRGMEIGDMVIATAAAKEEGTTKRYESVAYPAAPDFGTTRALVDAAEDRNEEVHLGPEPTTATTPRPTNTSPTGRRPACSPSRWRPPRCSLLRAGTVFGRGRSVPSTATSLPARRRQRPRRARNCRKRPGTTSSG